MLDPLRPQYVAARPSYIVTCTNLALFGTERIRLLAPESLSANLDILAANPDPARTNGFCRLFLDGHSQGVYYFEALRYLGIPPRSTMPLIETEQLFKSAGDYKHLFYLDALIAKQQGTMHNISPAKLQKRCESVAHLLEADVHHPWSRSEWRWRIKHLTAKNIESGLTLSAQDILGRNPASFYVTNHLDFAATPHLQWHSSHPAIIADNGRVTRPAGRTPVIVTLAATKAGDPGTQEVVRLTFRDLFRSFADTPECMRLAPHITWCDLFINGGYLGVYELSSSASKIWPIKFQLQSSRSFISIQILLLLTMPLWWPISKRWL